MGCIPLVSYVPNDAVTPDLGPVLKSPATYSLYPFMSPHALPWFMHSAGVFRIRRVAEWLLTTSPDIVRKSEGLADALLRSSTGLVLCASIAIAVLLIIVRATTTLKDALLPHTISEDEQDITIKAW